MIHAYNEYYLLMEQEKLGSMFEMALYEQNVDIDDFGELFINSRVSKAFETADPVLVAGKSANELLEIVLNKKLEQTEQASITTPAYWVGWVLAYTQWYTFRSFKEIIKAYPLSKLLLNYYPLHEADIMKTVKIIMKNLNMESKLKVIRKRKGYSQKDLSLLSNVPLRTIKAYEEGTLDIAKAQCETIYKLARTLNCTIEDLIK